MKNEKSLGELVKAFRKRNNLSIKDFITRLPTKISPAFMTKLELYGEIPSMEMVIEIADVIGHDPDELIEIAKTIKIEAYQKTLERKGRDALGFYREQKEKGKKL